MLRHKYTKKRMKNKYNRKKRTRKRGGVRNPKRKISAAKRREMERLSLRTPASEDNKMSAKDERDAQAKMSELLGEKCEATKHVNDDGSIDCPTNRSKAKKKINKFHPDKNPGCKDYATEMMSKYNETCYGDTSNVNRKWDKNDANYRHPEAKAAGFYKVESTASIKNESKQINLSESKQAISKQNEPLALMDGSVGPSAKDLITPQMKQEFPTVVVKQEDPVQPAVAMLEDRPQEIKVTETQKRDPTPGPISEVKQQLIQSPQPTPVAKTCFESKIDPTYGEVYYVEKYPDGSYTEKSQWEKPSTNQMCKRNKKMARCKTNNDCKTSEKSYCNPIQEKCNTLPNGWVTKQDESGKAYFYGQYSDGNYSESQYKVPTEAFNKNNPAVAGPTNEPSSKSETKSESKFSDSDIKFCADKVKRPHRGTPGLIKNKNRKDQTNCMVKNKRDPVICKVSRTDKRNIKKCVPKEINPHLKQKQQSNVKENFPDPIPSAETCFISQKDEASNKEYFVEQRKDGSYTGETQWEQPSTEQICKKTEQSSLKQRSWDADKTIGSCREMDLHPGAEYWIDPNTGIMSFEPIEGVKKQVAEVETDYYYNSEGKATFDPYDGTCGDVSKGDSKKVSGDASGEPKGAVAKKDYIKLFFSSHFNKINEIDASLADETKKVIPWLAKR